MRRWVKVVQVAAVVGCVALSAALAAVLVHRGHAAGSPARPVQVVAAGAGATVDPCTLVTADEASGVLGSTPVQNDSAGACTYTVVKDGFRSMSVSLGPDGIDPTKFQDGMDSYAQAANTTLLTVAGVGDEAYATVTDSVDQLVARSGTDYVTVVLINFTDPQSDILNTLQTLGQTALSRVH
jgi:hypothetical protein